MKSQKEVDNQFKQMTDQMKKQKGFYWDLINQFKQEVNDRAGEVDPDNELDWYAITLGWAIGKGVPPEDAYDFATFMGQYYLVVNKTKKQYLYPHLFNDGLKAWEIVANGETLKALGYLLVKSDGGGGGDLNENPLVGYWAGDEIIITGDDDSSKLYDEADSTYTDISTTVIKAMENEGVFNEKPDWFIKHLEEKLKEHPVIPFEQLSTTGKTQSPVTDRVIQHLAIDPDELEIL